MKQVSPRGKFNPFIVLYVQCSVTREILTDTQQASLRSKEKTQGKDHVKNCMKVWITKDEDICIVYVTLYC